ncbi:MAG: sensor domain-containing diguanylate cyclase [Candidatus Omnitrophota bacterium]|jgi:diguanylate cyclase (GGDEF)-like protein
MAAFLEKSFLVKGRKYNIALFLVHFAIPLLLSRILSVNPLKYLLAFYLVNTLIVIYFFKKSYSKSRNLELSMEGVQEEINLLNVEYSKELKNSIALKEKDLRYNSLAKILEKINLSLELDTVAEILVQEAFFLIGKEKGVGILYLIDSYNQKLILFRRRVENKGLVIKAKEGDILDLWVLRHGSPLLIEDIKNDFRFDPDKLSALDIRPISSLISAPFLIENKQLGILRLDSRVVGAYSQDDLRFLVSITDLGAVAIENSEFFKRTQDLAIHDSLTGLYTKGYFMERFKQECKRIIRQGGLLALMMLDIDFFKEYNDKFGHTAGDIVLQKLSRILIDSFAKFNPVICRFGGEEFCIAITGVEKREAYDIADSLRLKIENEKVVLRRSQTNITVSIGLANLPFDTMDDEELIRKADKAMYQAKQNGRNQVCCI